VYVEDYVSYDGCIVRSTNLDSELGNKRGISGEEEGKENIPEADLGR
jgi:hypothetical protein